MFTIATALARLAAGQLNLVATEYGAMSNAQQLARYNAILDEWFESDSWRGVKDEVALTSSSGIISLPAAYLRAEKRIVVTSDGSCGRFFEIKPKEYRYQPNGPGYFDVTKGCLGVAIDLGDNASGIRRYQLTGVTATLDTYAYSAFLRRRYVYATDTATVVIPDCYSALELSWRAMKARDDNAFDVSDRLWAQAYSRLDENLGQFNEGNELGFMQIDPQCTAPQYNAV